MKKILVVILLILLVPTLIGYVSQNFSLDEFEALVHTNRPVFLASLFLAKSASIVYPPLPGSLFTFGSIPFIGWQWAYVLDLAGSASGATVAFFLGKRYGLRILNWALGENITQKITNIKLKDRNQIESAFFLRIAAGGVLSDGFAWGASLIKLNYFPFIIGYILSHLLITLPLFYFVSRSLDIKAWTLFLPVAGLAIFILYKFKGRYFE